MWIKEFLFNIIFPIHCLGCGQEKSFICTQCVKTIPITLQKIVSTGPLENIFIALDYNHYLVKKAVHAFKYPPYAWSLSGVLSGLLINSIKASPELISYLTKDNFVLVPVPLSRTKFASRGFNQAELIAQELSQEFKLPVLKVLKKIKNNLSQTELTYEEREINVKNVFDINTGFKNGCPKNIILVDDILTTGATLKQEAKILNQAGYKKIWAIVLAKG